MSEITNEDIRSICTCPKTIDGYLSYTADNCMIHNSRYMLKVVRDKDKRIVELEIMVEIGLKNTGELYYDHMQSLGRTTKKNITTAEILQAEIKLMKNALRRKNSEYL
jgi:hypothetical protein